EGEREGAKGYPRFTDPRLRPEGAYADYIRMATERSLERCGIDYFDVLLLHNPDRTGFRSEAVWTGMEAVRAAGLTRLLGVAPGPMGASGPGEARADAPVRREEPAHDAAARVCVEPLPARRRVRRSNAHPGARPAGPPDRGQAHGARRLRPRAARAWGYLRSRG